MTPFNPRCRSLVPEFSSLQAQLQITTASLVRPEALVVNLAPYGDACPLISGIARSEEILLGLNKLFTRLAETEGLRPA